MQKVIGFLLFAGIIGIFLTQIFWLLRHIFFSSSEAGYKTRKRKKGEMAAMARNTIESELAAKRGLTLEQWKKEGEKLVALYNDNQKLFRHPYTGINSEKSELLQEYWNWVYGGLV